MNLFVRTAALVLALAAPFVLAQEVKFTAGDTVRDIPFKTANNLVIVEASIGKAPAGWFIFDRGREHGRGQ